MGFGNNGKPTLYFASNFTRAEVIAINQGLFNASQPGGGSQRATIAVDANWVAHQRLKISGGPVGGTATVLTDWATKGGVILPVADGETRPISKQVTNESRAKRKRGENKATLARLELRKVNSTINAGGLDEEARNEAVKKRTQLLKDITSGESESTKKVPTNFHVLLEDMLCNLSAHQIDENSNGTVREVMTAEFQADSLMGGLFEAGKVQLLMTKDADLPIVYGDKCIIITKCSGKTFTLASTCNKTLSSAISYLDESRQPKIKLDQPKYPIFEGVTDRRLRVLMMVICGCDVCPKGVHNAGPAWVQKTIQSIKTSGGSEQQMYDRLIEHAVILDPRFTAEILNIYVDAVVYEPINEEGKARAYMDNKPAKLPHYLEEFKADGTVIDLSLEVKECKCTGGDTRHKFLAAVDHHICSNCEETVCHLCAESINAEAYCLECYVVEEVLPGININSRDFVPIWQMRKELKEKYNFDHVDQLSPDDVESVWVEHAFHESLKDKCNKHLLKLPTSAIHSGELRKLATIDLRFGGAFIRDPQLDSKYIPKIMELMASFVYFDSSETKHTNWLKDASIYSAMPKMFIDMAEACRVGLGYRLLKRTVRHALDNRTAPLDVAGEVELILYEDNVGIALTTPVAASMKTDIYPGTSVLTKDGLLCAECDCMSGSKDDEKVACVHTPTRGYKLTLLLSEDLAQHLLFQFAAMISAADIETATWNEEEIASMKTSISILVQATGEMELAETMAKEKSLYDMLTSFQTGTQKSNEWKRANKAPSPDEILPITEIDFSSPEHKAKVALNKTSPKVQKDFTPPIKFDPDYPAVQALCNAAGISPSRIPHIGFELMAYRHEMCQENADSHAERLQSVQPKWNALMEEAATRSRNSSPAALANLLHAPVITLRRSERILKIIYDVDVETASTPAKRYKKPGKTYCAKKGCSNHSHMPGITMNRVPPMPPALPKNASKKRILTYARKLAHRRESMDRCGHSRNDSRKNLRVCSEHEFEQHTTSIKFTHNDITIEECFEMEVIVAAGKSSSLIPSENTKGLGNTRAMTRILNEVKIKSMAQVSSVDVLAATESELEKERRFKNEAERTAAEMMMVTQQVVECHSKEESPVGINPTLAKVAGLVQFNPKSDVHPSKKRKFKVFSEKSTPLRKTDEEFKLASELPPSILPSIKDSEVKRRTGFPDVKCMLGYIIVITNGNIDLIKKRSSSLTWFEEWFRYLEWKYGKVCGRQTDRRSEWGICDKHVDAIIDCKAAIDKGALLSWPRFASYDEDLALRDPSKWSHYDGPRTVLWDMTNVPCPKYEDGSVQRTTWSSYYGTNCFKGGVGNQFCGWTLAWDLWGGSVSDDGYSKDSGILEAQDEYAQSDLVDGEVISFSNIQDRGFRTSYAAWNVGKQTVIQPPFAKSDKRFTGQQTIYSGMIARDRSGNERGVNVSKRSGLIKRGFQEGMSAKRFNDAWLTWAFQANFMYKKVL